MRIKKFGVLVSSGLAFLMLGVFTLIPGASAEECTLTVFDVPGSAQTFPRALNNAGQIAGYYNDSSGVPHGFLRNADGSFVTFDPPSSVSVGPFLSINDLGQIAGYYTNSSGTPHGFLRNADGSFVTFNPLGSIGTYPQTINNNGQMAGYYSSDSSGEIHGFLRNTDGTFATFDALDGGTQILPSVINDSGQIAGYYIDSSSKSHGFVRNTDGSFGTFDVPDSLGIYVGGINDSGQISGGYSDLSANPRGFVRNSDGSFVTFDAPESIDTYPNDINGSGQVTGRYRDNVFAQYRGFIRNPDGSLETFSASGDIQTFPNSINNVGQISGHLSSPGNFDGFLRSCGSPNQPPTATADAYEVVESQTLTVGAPGVLGNDSDPDGDSLVAVLDTGPTNGVLTLNANGSFTYTPNAGFTGNDAFTYHANDGSLDSGITTVTITVTGEPPENQPPTAAPDTYQAVANTTLTVPAPGVLGNDSDPDGTPLTAVLNTGSANGLVTLNANGSFTYAPTAGFTGTTTFTYKASDGALQSGTATVTIVVAGQACTTRAGTVIPGLTSLEALEAQYPPPTPGLAVDFNNQVHANPANTPLYLNYVIQELVDAVNDFEQRILGLGTTTFTITSGYRPEAYQAHLYEIDQKRLQLKNADLKNPACVTLKAQVDNEFTNIHGLGGGVNPPGSSLHEVGKAVDIVICETVRNKTSCINLKNKRKDTIGGINIDTLAASSSLKRTCGIGDPVHYSLIIDPDTGEETGCSR